MKLKKLLLLLVAAAAVISELYSVSIQDLINQHKIPKIRGIGIALLDLSGMGIDSLEGLSNIPGIEKVKILRLANNNITRIPPEAFKAAKELRALGLASNGLEIIEPNAFKGLSKLWVLILNSNKINDIPNGALRGLNKNLQLLALGSNPITAEKIKVVKKRVRHAYVITLPITAANLKRAGAVAAGVITVALVVTGAVVLAEKSTPRPPEDVPGLAHYLERFQSDPKIPLRTQWEKSYQYEMERISDALEATGLIRIKKDPLALLSELSGVVVNKNSRPADLQRAYDALYKDINTPDPERDTNREAIARELINMLKTPQGRENWLAFAQETDNAVDRLKISEAQRDEALLKLGEASERLKESSQAQAFK